ncbi:MAG: flagellar basal body protein [Pirellulaceae bacterium]|nr:hypothetical protein [Planctomycetales bacterium]MCA9266012.1 hypothetical protein [Planctomycetales bacterium]
MSVIPSQFGVLARALEVGSARHQVVSQNLANVNTPGYRAAEVRFEEEMASYLRHGDTDSNGPAIHVLEGGAQRIDGNNVDIDQQIGLLQENASRFQACMQLLSSQLQTMRSAITGR